MILMVILLTISIILNIILIYGSITSIKKIEYYENKVIKFYDGCIKILQTCRSLDNRQMFEKDDDVGVLFNQLIEIIGELRLLIYNNEEQNEEE